MLLEPKETPIEKDIASNSVHTSDTGRYPTILAQGDGLQVASVSAVILLWHPRS